VPYASVYPLVSARSLARPFTYEVGEEIGKGAVLSVQFGAAKRRGVVVGLEDAPPDGVDAISAGKLLDELPPALVDLALWTADYYGSTPARALSLVAPPKPARRGERREPSRDYALAGEAEPAELTGPQQEALARIDAAAEAGGGHFLLHGATGSGKTEVYLQACAATIARGSGAIVLVPRDRVARLRMQLAESGLPKGGGVGYDIFDKSDTMGGMATMANVDSIDVRPGGTLEFSPGGFHLMCMKPMLKPGDKVSVTLHFAGGTQVKSDFAVRGANGR